MTSRKTLEYKGTVAFLGANSSGEYYVVADTTRTPTTVKRYANHKTTVCLRCHAWEGVSDTGEVNEIGCKHTNLVEYAVANDVVERPAAASDILPTPMSSALRHAFVDEDEPERGAIPE